MRICRLERGGLEMAQHGNGNSDSNGVEERQTVRGELRCIPCNLVFSKSNG